MKQKLLLATRNQKKKAELQQILQGMAVDIITLEDLPELPEVVEDGQSFEENAIKKARQTARLSGYPCLADDSGLMVDALGGMPGIYSARFAGEPADDQKNNDKLLQMMKDVAEEQRTARFVCVIALCTPSGQVQTVKGSCEGKIAIKPSGQGGFGYDPLFIPQGYQESFACLPAEIKNTISHRARALQQCKPLIEQLLDS